MNQQLPIISEELQKDERMRHFMMDMSEEEKDRLTCDEVFSLYLRHVSKQVNDTYYRNVIRFILLYRECLNEYGWLKRREHYKKAYSEEIKESGGCVDDYDEILRVLKERE